MSDGNVIDFTDKFDIEAALRLGGKPQETPADMEQPERPAAEPEAALPLDQLGPLPRLGDPYAAHSRLSNAPLPMLFLLPKGGLPWGIAYPHIQEVLMVEAEKPGGGPDLLLLVAGMRPKEVRIEARDLLALCDRIGRHLIHWIREHPTGRDDGTAAVFIRRITITGIDR
jgi:hypothetical protein